MGVPTVGDVVVYNKAEADKGAVAQAAIVTAVSGPDDSGNPYTIKCNLLVFPDGQTTGVLKKDVPHSTKAVADKDGLAGESYTSKQYV